MSPSLARLAAWESTAVQNLDSLLDESGADRLWAEILAFREHLDVARFRTQARAIAAESGHAVSHAVEHVIRSVESLFQDAVPEPASDPLPESVPPASSSDSSSAAQAASPE